MKRILPTIVIAQFFCTSVWFAGNAVMGDIAMQLHVEPAYLGHLTSSVQTGFIAGTLVFALLSVADRFSPTKVFFFCAVASAVINLGVSLNNINSTELIFFRMLTGFSLAGIYPVGMKIAADHYQEGLGKSLGFLVGALVLGTAFPHLLKSLSGTLPWKYVIFFTSALSLCGGVAMMLLVPDGPYRKIGHRLKLTGFLDSFRNKNFRAAAFGYFGHMWEVYAFWMFVPLILTAYNSHHPAVNLNIPLLSFLVIASGSAACVIGGFASKRFGVKRTAATALTISGLCCVVSPLLLFSGSIIIFILFLFIWGMSVAADSPLFSTLVAQNAPQENKGTSLTIVNCIGFSITIVSIQLISALRNDANMQYIYMLLSIGPVLGLLALWKVKSKRVD